MEHDAEDEAMDGSRVSGWTVYMLRCGDGSLYTGIARDLARRLNDHRQGAGARYTRGRGPLTIVYEERCGDRSRAQEREAAIKRLSRARKEALIRASGGGRAEAGIDGSGPSDA